MTHSNKGKTLPGEVYTQEEFTALLKQCSRRYPTGQRNRALLIVGYRCGLRLAEALALHLRDVDTKGGHILVRCGKGGKRRQVGIDPGSLEIVQRWIDTRKALGLNGRQPLFCTLKGDELKQAYVREFLARIGTKAGIEKRIHYHGLRHSYAWQLSEAGVPVVKIQRALGHSSLATTSRYLDHVAPLDVIEWALSAVVMGLGIYGLDAQPQARAQVEPRRPAHGRRMAGPR